MIFLTTFQAIDPTTDKLEEWIGENIVADSFEEAQLYCREFKGHLSVVGILIGEVGFEEGLFPTFDFNLN